MDQVNLFIRHYEHLESDSAKKNKEYVNAEIARCARVFDDIDGISLDRQQRGHNIIKYDLKFLERHDKSVMAIPAIDTLALSPLLFPKNRISD